MDEIPSVRGGNFGGKLDSNIRWRSCTPDLLGIYPLPLPLPPPCYIRKIRSIRKIARGRKGTNRTALSRTPSPPLPPLPPRGASDNRSLIAFVIPIINNASIAQGRGEERGGDDEWPGELNALTRIIGLR